MFNVMKGVISAGGYKLAEICYKVKKLYLLGDITELEMDQLLRLASAGVSAEAERPEVLALIRTLAEAVEALNARVKALEGGEDGPNEENSPWKPWDGISKDYQPGAVVSHNGKLWESVFGGQNVWEPGAVDETFWKVTA